MSLIDRIKNFFPFRNSSNRGALESYNRALPNIFGNYAGKRVDEKTALTLSAIWACTKVLSESVASLPFKVYEKMADGDKILRDDHRLYNIINKEPSKFYTTYTFIEYLMKSMCLNGNGYAIINRDRNASVVSFTCVNPSTVKIIQDGGFLFYKVKGYNEPISSEDMIHVKNITQDGLIGLSPVEYAAESIGWGLALQTYGNTFFGNGAMPSGILKTSKNLTTESAERLKNSWLNNHGGINKSNKVAVLEDDLDFKPISLSNEAAQFLASRQFSIAEIARWYRVPPHLIQDLSKSSFNNIEMQSLEFVQYTLMPYLVRLEQEFNRKIFKVKDKNRLFVEFNTAGLLRGDAKTRADLYAKAINWGWMSINEVRRKENMNSIPDGDEHWMPLNMGIAKENKQENEAE